MRPEIKLSTKFLNTQNTHQVGLLITVGADQPPRRAPINVALVLDRSGSMSGQPLEAAKRAATRFAELLGPNDRVSVAAFDDQVHTVFGPAPGGDSAAAQAIAHVYDGGSTNLSGGWLKGREHVQSGLAEGTNRVVLFTDGNANAGITAISQLVELARGAATQRVTTTCIGFGASFNEELMRSMSQAGGGNYWYVEAADQMTDMFSEEIEGLVALAAQNVEVEVRLTHPGAAGVTFLQRLPTDRTPGGGWRITLGDLYATSPKAVGLIFHVEDVTELGHTQVAEVRLVSDVVMAEGIEHRVITLPVFANLDGTDHGEPNVERTFVRFEAARAREEAIEQADRGDLAQAAMTLAEASTRLHPFISDPLVAEEVEDLRAESERLRTREYSSLDRKYHEARSHAAWENKDAYLGKLSRQRPNK
jgi:Ca-activated chloride channel family protein